MGCTSARAGALRTIGQERAGSAASFGGKGGLGLVCSSERGSSSGFGVLQHPAQSKAAVVDGL